MTYDLPSDADHYIRFEDAAMGDYWQQQSADITAATWLGGTVGLCALGTGIDYLFQKNAKDLEFAGSTGFLFGSSFFVAYGAAFVLKHWMKP